MVPGWLSSHGAPWHTGSWPFSWFHCMPRACPAYQPEGGVCQLLETSNSMVHGSSESMLTCADDMYQPPSHVIWRKEEGKERRNGSRWLTAQLRKLVSPINLVAGGIIDLDSYKVIETVLSCSNLAFGGVLGGNAREASIRIVVLASSDCNVESCGFMTSCKTEWMESLDFSGWKSEDGEGWWDEEEDSIQDVRLENGHFD